LAGIPAFLDRRENGIFILGEAGGVPRDQGDVSETADCEGAGDGDADAGAGAEDLFSLLIRRGKGEGWGGMHTTRVLPGIFLLEGWLFLGLWALKVLATEERYCQIREEEMSLRCP
jgi:hypothetical protein